MIAIVCTAVAATALMGVAGMSTDSPDGFTACMRAHGAPGFPDATVTPDGRLVLEPGAVDPFDAGYRAALATCADELPAGMQLPTEPRPPAPPQSPDVSTPEDPRPPAPPAVPSP